MVNAHKAGVCLLAVFVTLGYHKPPAQLERFHPRIFHHATDLVSDKFLSSFQLATLTRSADPATQNRNPSANIFSSPNSSIFHLSITATIHLPKSDQVGG